MRVAWFSPLPPDRSGIAAYSAEITPLLRPAVRSLDLYTADRHDFVWRHRRAPYDLTVYQLGNSEAHDFMWAYLFRYPGLLVLHDAQLHQARALWLLRRLEPRLDDYLTELAANHPEAPPGLGHLFAAGLGGHLYRHWPMVSLAIRASRLTAVHNATLAARLEREHPGARIRHIEMGVADLTHVTGTVPDPQSARRALAIPDTACVIGAFGGITPEKRIPELLAAVAASRRHDAHVLLVGQRAAHYDVDADIARHGLAARVHVTGYVPDHQLSAYLAAADICWCLRWPSNGETSASWIRCLEAGKPTMVTALAQMRDVPLLAVNTEGVASVSKVMDAIGVAIDPVDEARDIRLALEALTDDGGLRATLGGHARARWERLHTLPRMAQGYQSLLQEAATLAPPVTPLPSHLMDEGTDTARRILAEMGVSGLPW
jgi:glycosyltransferase involved in cell wall biosynthesis